MSDIVEAALARMDAPTPPDRSIFDSGTTPGLAPGSVATIFAFNSEPESVWPSRGADNRRKPPVPEARTDLVELMRVVNDHSKTQTRTSTAAFKHDSHSQVLIPSHSRREHGCAGERDLRRCYACKIEPMHNSVTLRIRHGHWLFYGTVQRLQLFNASSVRFFRWQANSALTP